MAREFFKNLPDTSTPLSASRINGLLNGAEPMGSIVVEDVIGKNLFDKNDNIQSGSFTDTGVIDTSSDKFVQLSYIPVESSKNYILHAGTVPDRLVICEYDSNKNFIKRNISLGTYTLVVATTSTTKYLRVCSGIAVLDTLQLEKGSTATEYTEFKKFGYNSQESMGKIVVDDISSKNLFNKYGSLSDYDGWNSGETILQSDGTIKATANMANGNGKGQFINVKPNTKYTMSFKVIEMEVSGYYYVRIKSVDDSSKTILYTYEGTRTGNGKFTFQTNSDTNKIWVSICGINNASNVNEFKYVIYDDIQVELGEATPYTPYKNFAGRTDIITGQEMPTNEYVDGKRVYVKRIDCGALPNATSKSVDTGLSRLENTFERFVGKAIRSTYAVMLPNLSTSGLANSISCGIDLSAGNMKIEIVTGIDRSDWNAVVDIYYTKLTDTSTASTMSLRPDTTEEGELDG